MVRFLISYIGCLFAYIAISLGLYLFLDVIITSVRFLFVGEFSSFLQVLVRGDLTPETGPLFSSWSISTPLAGFDYLLNSFMALQFSVSGRWVIEGVSVGIFIVISFLSSLLDFEIKFYSTKNPSDISLESMFALFTTTALLLPIWFAPMNLFVWLVSLWI